MTSAVEARAIRAMSNIEAQLRFQLPRLPKYAAHLILRSPIGLYRVLAALLTWALDPTGREAAAIVRKTAAKDGRGVSSVRGLEQDHRRQVLIRLSLVAVLLAIFPVLIYFGYQAWPQRAASGIVLLFCLGWWGSKGQVVDRPNSDAVRPAVSHRLIEQALDDVGINRVTKAMKTRREAERPPVDFITDVVHTGSGLMVTFDMPGSVPVTQLIRAREDLAGGLRRPAECVWPMPQPEASPARCKLVILDEPMAKSARVPWPGATEDRSINIVRDPITLGVSPDGQKVDIHLRWSSGVTGAQPRVGKTFTDRVLAVSALEDDRLELHVYALRATGEFAPLRPLCAAYRSGDSPADLEAMVLDLKWAQKEIRRRAELLDSLPEHLTLESKVTPELSADPTMGLHPVMFLIDEIQLATLHAIHGQFITEALVEMGTIGQAVGFILKVATQRPSAEWLPPAIRDNMMLRICLAVKTQQANDMILGQGMHAAGHRATPPSLTRADLGTALVVGEDGEPRACQVYYADAAQVSAKVARLKARREASGGLLVGLAAGEELPHLIEDENDADDLLSVVARTWPVEEDTATSAEIIGAITQVPGFETMTSQRMTRRLKEVYLVQPVAAVMREVDGKKKNAGRGHSLSEILRAQRAMRGDSEHV